jgi:hypothetical protein
LDNTTGWLQSKHLKVLRCVCCNVSYVHQVWTLKRAGNVCSLGYVNCDTLFRYFCLDEGLSLWMLKLQRLSLSVSLSDVNGSHAMFSLFQLLPALKPSHMDILQNSLIKYSGNPIEHYAPCTWNLDLLQHFYICALLEFLRIFFVQQSAVRQSVRPINCILLLPTITWIPCSPSQFLRSPPPPHTLHRDTHTQGCLCFYGTSQSHKPGGTPPRIWVARSGRIAQRSFTHSKACESQKCEMKCVISYRVIKWNCLHSCHSPESLLPG